MILLGPSTDKLQLITSAAGDVDAYVSWVDNASGTISPGRTAVSAIATAATTDITPAPAASTYRAVKVVVIRNNHATVAQTAQLQYTDGTNTFALWAGQLLPGESIWKDDTGDLVVYTAAGVIKAAGATGSIFNASTAATAAGFATDTYLVGSNILIPATRPKVGTLFRCIFSVSKTAAGTATPIIQLRYGTAASTADTSLCSFTFSAGTAATDVGLFEVIGLYRSVGATTAAVVQGHCSLISQPTTGFSSLLKGVQTTSAGHDSTTANTYLGVSVNGGTGAVWTVQMVQSELRNIY